MLTNTGVTLVCLGITCTVFAAVYAVVYRITAKTYYNIVKKVGKAFQTDTGVV